MLRNRCPGTVDWRRSSPQLTVVEDSGMRLREDIETYKNALKQRERKEYQVSGSVQKFAKFTKGDKALIKK